MDSKNFSSFQERVNDLKQGQQENALSFGPKYRVIRFYLDSAADRFTVGVDSHFIGSGIKSFWVCNTNNRNFSAKIVPNPKSDRNKDSGLPLKYNMNISFAYPVHDACLEFSSQPGVWVEIAFSESEDISVGNSDVALSGKVSPNEGSTYTSAKMSASTTPAILLAADDARLKAVVQHKSGSSIWVGSQADLNNADYQNICLELPAGSTTEIWTTGALYFRDNSSTAVCSVMIFKA